MILQTPASFVLRGWFSVGSWRAASVHFQGLALGRVPVAGQRLVPGEDTSFPLVFCLWGPGGALELRTWGLASPSVCAHLCAETQQASGAKGACARTGENSCLCLSRSLELLRLPRWPPCAFPGESVLACIQPFRAL